MTKENNNEMNEDNTPHIAINAQYIKDLSFENPGAPNSLIDIENPKLDITLDIKVIELDEEDFYEVTISVDAKAKDENTVYYVLDLKYAGVFNLINIPKEQKQPILAIHCPTMLFPFARKIIADITQDGGFQSLLIDPVDFAMLYNKKLKENIK